ncbi:phage tail tape measure protein [Paenibacillus cisolokensis]|uniref:phage tail tape measure protein n=1 Tax=Paenibacillus cisolokensis TaxID=1658519 RepID=UPI003D2A18AA
MAQGKSREYEIAFRLNGELESSFRKTFGQAGESIERIERELRDISGSNAFGKISKEARDAERVIRSVEGDTRNFGDTLKRVAEYTGAFAIVDGVANSFRDIFSTIRDFDDSMANLQAATGASAEEMQEIEQIAEELYELPLSEGIHDLTNSIATVKQVTQQSGDELQQMTKEAILFRDVFGEDITESVKAADTMMRQFRITSTQAYNLLAQGAQKGLNKSNELLDTANEYAPQFASLGYTANEMFDILASGLAAGAWNLDKVGDAVKEFNIRLKDGSDTTYKALAALLAPEDIEKWTEALTRGGTKSAEYLELVGKVGKETAGEMVKNLQKGGKKAEDTITTLSAILGGGQDLLDGLSSGAIQGKDALQTIVDELAEIQDPLEQAQLGVALFGTQWEDVEKDVISAFGATERQFDMTKATMEEIEQIKLDTIGKDFQKVGRQLMTGLVLPIAEDLMPALEGLAEWATENDELIKAIALATPAALIGKNVLTIVKGFGRVDDAVATATKGVGAANKALGSFGSVLGFFTNPVGIAVGAVGALTAGVLAYKKHQEDARLELINMSEELEEAAKQYEEVASKYSTTQDLVSEYQKLDSIIRNNTDASRDLNTEKQRLADITSQLQELYPETITQYDIENGKIREKLGLLQQESAAEAELARLRLEKEVAEKSRDLPDLEKEIASLEKQTTELEKQKDALDAAIPAFKEFEAQFARIMQMDASDERTSKLEELRQKVNEIGSTVGFHFNNNAQLMELGSVIDDLTGDRVEKIDAYITKLEELGNARASYEELYQAQKTLIELDLGSKLEEQAANFENLTEAERERFMSALQEVSKLNAEMDLLPTEKTIDLKVVWSQIGRPATWGLPDIPGYAEGGYVDSPELAWVGEGGSPEWIIPENNSPRSHALLDAANRAMGRKSDGGSVVINAPFKPVINIPGGSADAGQIKQAIGSAYEEWVKNLRKFMREERRLSFNA